MTENDYHGTITHTRSDTGGSQIGDNSEDHISMLFDMCRKEDGKACIKAFFEELARIGIRSTDPRLKNMIDLLKNLSTLPSYENLRLDQNTFKAVLSENIVFITKAFQNRMVIPAFEPFCDNIKLIYEKCRTNNAGLVADILPQLAQAGADKFGIAICTVDGQRFSIGDVEEPFSIQQIARPVAYGIAVSELGEDIVHEYQGKEPSGRKQSAIALDINNKPFNPLETSGGILSASILLQLVKPELDDLARKYEYVQNIFERLCGGEYLEFNNSIFLQEKTCVDRDFSLAYFMRENKCFPEGADIKKILEFYFQMTSLEMTCESNSVLAGTLANNGTCPITGERILNTQAVTNVLSLMYSCGMSIYSGQFAFTIGLPAMSSISGGIMLVIPNVMGICIWSPPLDKIRNSVRGVQFCKELVNIYQFHRFEGVGESQHFKIDPTLKKSLSRNELGIIVLFAAANGDLLTLKRSFLQDFDMNMCDYDGRTALHLTAAEGHLDAVVFLLEICKVYPEPKDRWNQTPLSEAVRFGHLHIAAYLRKFIDSNPNQSWDSSALAYDQHDYNEYTEEEEEHKDGDGDGEVLDPEKDEMLLSLRRDEEVRRTVQAAIEKYNLAIFRPNLTNKHIKVQD